MKQTLRPYQEEAVLRCRKAMVGCGSVLLQLPTGAGKTTIAAEIIRRSSVMGKKVLFLAHRKEIIDQAYDRFTGFGMDCSVVRSKDERFDPKKNIQIGSIQTCSHKRRSEYMSSMKPDLIIIDEAHHSPAKTYVKVLKACAGSAVIGLSATPYRSDGRGLGSITDSQTKEVFPLFKKLIRVETTGSLIEKGFLSPCEVWVPQVLNFSKVKLDKGDFAKSELEEIFVDEDLMENLVKDWKKYCDGMQTIVFASSVFHSQALCRVFNKEGIPAAHIDGKTPKEEREKKLKALADKKIKVVSNYAILTEGFDCPAVSALILARPTMSMALYKQMVGRGLRINDDKEKAVILDYGKNVTRHVFPTTDPTADLSGGVNGGRGEETKKEGFTGSWICPKCMAAIPMDNYECRCGYQRTMPEIQESTKEYTLKKVKERKPLTHGEKLKRRLKFFELEQRDKENGYNLWHSCIKYSKLYDGKKPHEDGILDKKELAEYWRARAKKKKGSDTT